MSALLKHILLDGFLVALQIYHNEHHGFHRQCGESFPIQFRVNSVGTKQMPQ